MIINSTNLRNLGTAWNAAFKRGLGMADVKRKLISTEVPSSTSENEYGWLGQFPGMREWLGDRVINSIKSYGYTIKNKDWEDTIGVPRNAIKDDNIGIFSTMFEEMGRAAEVHPDQLIWALLKAGFFTECYDGQYFFDTDHPVLDEAGNTTSVANTDGGSGTPWFLFDDTRALKPLIFQMREKLNFVAKDNPDDDNVFNRKEFLYGVDARYNVGFGFWQYIWGSKQDLTPANYGIARAALGSMKGDYGRPLGNVGKVLVVPSSLESKGLKILNNEMAAGGETNEWKGTARLEVVPWLA